MVHAVPAAVEGRAELVAGGCLRDLRGGVLPTAAVVDGQVGQLPPVPVVVDLQPDDVVRVPIRLGRDARPAILIALVVSDNVRCGLRGCDDCQCAQHPR